MEHNIDIWPQNIDIRPRPPTSRAQLCQTVAACAMNGSTYLGSLLAQAGALFGTH